MMSAITIVDDTRAEVGAMCFVGHPTELPNPNVVLWSSVSDAGVLVV
jgi:hypothetical protein